MISEAEASAVIEQHAPHVRLLEVVCDTYSDPASLEYHQNHEVPGFFQISTDRFEQAPSWNLKPIPQIIGVLEQYALIPNSDARVILYDNIQISCGTTCSRFDASSRLYSILKYFGIKNVSIIMDCSSSKHFVIETALTKRQFSVSV